jgi:hypothetical protein
MPGLATELYVGEAFNGVLRLDTAGSAARIGLNNA